MGADAPLAAIVATKAGALPLTSSGKVRRRACLHQFLDGRLAGIVALDPSAGRLAAPARQARPAKAEGA